MNKNRFIIIFLLTIVVTRLSLYFIPRTSSIYTDKFHHIYLGILLLAIYLIFKSETLLAITSGLIIDEITALPFFILDLMKSSIIPNSFWQYWSPYSIISTIILTIISIRIIKKCK